MLRRLSITSGMAFVALVLPLWSQGHALNRSQMASASGQRIFASTCAGCHGLDGRGGERAPSLASAKVRQLSDRELFAIVSHGVPGTAMPGFRALAPGERRALVAYLRTLQNEGRTVPLRGNPVLGKSLFFGKAKCSTCHMVNGQGGFIAGDLSAYGRDHSSEEILNRILAPQADQEVGRVAVVTTNDGQTYRGLVRNEDNFSLQLQSLDGAFHLFTKSELKDVAYEPEPLMPASYASLLTRKELDDIVRYLIESAASSSMPVQKKQE